MVTRKLIVLFSLFFGCLFVLSAQTRQQLQESYMTYLKNEGYNPTIDSDGDILFKSEGSSYYIYVNEDDLEFFRLVYLANYELETAREKTQFPLAIEYANKSTKVSKVTSRDDGGRIMISTEVFLGRPDDFRYVFKRMLSSNKAALSNFVEKMRE